MEEIGIDVDVSSQILGNINSGAYDNVQPVVASAVPDSGGRTLIARRGDTSVSVPEQQYRSRLADIAPEIPPDRFGRLDGTTRFLDRADLEAIGTLLTPYLAYGVLNGGSATSYADRKKNQAFDPELFELYRDRFSELADVSRGHPKGLTPAYINPDGSHGASFLELKFRMILRWKRRYAELASELGVPAPRDLQPLAPLFEMTSLATENAVREAYASWRSSEYLAGLEGHTDVLETEHAVQPLIAAFTHSSEGTPRYFFTSAYGRTGEPLGLPGGHGQNFAVLAEVYRSLRDREKRFVYLGNVDNLGYTADPVSLAILAIRGSAAGFDFVFRTPVDVKGGVLVYDQHGRLNCADIGPAIKKEDVFRYEDEGKNILFNCATGLFDLRYLADSIDSIVSDLPMRISDQDKDAGRYSQAEQVTWEIIGMLDDMLVFGVDKYRRFLAAKMLTETLLTSGLELEQAARHQPSVRDLHSGLSRVLSDEYGLVLENDRWRPSDAP
jgi:UDP-N-acetylglucosamine pyrophosphorylase